MTRRALMARAGQIVKPAEAAPTPWATRAAKLAEEAETAPCVGWGPHTTYTVEIAHGVRLCWACWVKGYELVRVDRPRRGLVVVGEV